MNGFLYLCCRLHAREDGSQRVCIAGLTETEATDVQSLMQVTSILLHL